MSDREINTQLCFVYAGVQYLNLNSLFTVLVLFSFSHQLQKWKRH